MTATDDSTVSSGNNGVPENAPQEVKDHAATAGGQSRKPNFDATLGAEVHIDWQGKPRNRLVVIGDSLSHGFQSGAIFNTDLSYGAIIAYELGWLDSFRYPRYGGRGGLPLNIELLLRDLEKHLGSTVSFWELPHALFEARQFMDDVEDYWERGPGSALLRPASINHALAVYGWDVRDALDWNATLLADAVKAPKDDLIKQIVENNTERAALRVYPLADGDKGLSLFGAAEKLGEDTAPDPNKEPDPDPDHGIETLVVFLGANNALQSVTNLKVNWSGDGYDRLDGKGKYTVWRPEHFRSELGHVVDAVRRIKARHVIWCTVPHVTIVPISRGVGDKLRPGSRYYPYYTRPWIEDKDFNPSQDENITGEEARAVDYAIDLYNADIEKAVLAERTKTAPDGTPDPSDWLLLDTAGLLDRLAARRYINDPNARPDWWTPYPLPPALKALQPEPDSRFLVGDGNGGRGAGGLFSLDGVHPTTVAYGLIAQEMINIMQRAGVTFQHPNGGERHGPVQVDFDRLILRDTLVRYPPQILRSGLKMLAWADERLDWIRRTLS